MNPKINREAYRLGRKIGKEAWDEAKAEVEREKEEELKRKQNPFSFGMPAQPSTLNVGWR